MDALDERAIERGEPLRDLALIHCDHGWSVPHQARVMPPIPCDVSVRSDHWRNHAGFAIVSTALDGRRPAIEALVAKLGGSPSPMSTEWLQTVDRVAKLVRYGQIDATWDDFLTSLVAVLPADLQSEPKPGTPDPLAIARFLPDQNGRLISPSDPAKLFFQPVRGIDDAAELVGMFQIPSSSTLHSSIPASTHNMDHSVETRRSKNSSRAGLRATSDAPNPPRCRTCCVTHIAGPSWARACGFVL